jgi:hypothetical protein
MAHTIALISDMFLHMLAALVVVALLLCPLVLLVMVCYPMVDLIMITYTFLRDLRKPPTQIIATDTEPSKDERQGMECDASHQDVDTPLDRLIGELGLKLEPDNDRIYSGNDHDIQKAPTQIYARNTLMGLPAELRLMIWGFALQADMDSIVCAPPSPLSV